MHFKLIETINPNTTAFRLSPGMKFVRTNGELGEPIETETHEHVMVCVAAIEGVPRTVIHAAHRGEPDSWGYGFGCHRIVDGVSDPLQALQLQGYEAAP